jgi:hypothetical protein
MNLMVRFAALATPAKFLVIDAIAQHDPEPNPELPGSGDSSFPYALLSEFSTGEPLQRGISTNGRDGSHQRNRKNGFPCFVSLPSRCRAPLEYSLGISPT